MLFHVKAQPSSTIGLSTLHLLFGPICCKEGKCAISECLIPILHFGAQTQITAHFLKLHQIKMIISTIWLYFANFRDSSSDPVHTFPRHPGRGGDHSARRVLLQLGKFNSPLEFKHHKLPVLDVKVQRLKSLCQHQPDEISGRKAKQRGKGKMRHSCVITQL